jgi:hypothetical protein
MDELRRHHETDERLFFASLVGICGGVILGIMLPIALAYASSLY